MIEKARRGGGILELFLPTRRGGREHEAQEQPRLQGPQNEIWVSYAARKVLRKLATLDVRRASFGLLRDLPHRVSWDKALEGRRAKQSWLVFKDPPSSGVTPTKRKPGKNVRMALDEQGTPVWTQTLKESLQRLEVLSCSLGRKKVFWVATVHEIVKAKPSLEKCTVYICKQRNKKNSGNCKSGSPILVPSKIMK